MKRLRILIAVCVVFLTQALPANGAQVILNEYNAVGGSKQLDDGAGADSFFGTVDGNGGNWFELLVIEDHVDMRGWQFQWAEDEEVSPGVTAAGTITLSEDTIWSDLRSGSIVTMIETINGAGAEKNTATDVSYDPHAGDWWINVATQEEQAKGTSALATTTTNDGNAGDFSVGKDHWQLTIVDSAGDVVFGPVGEGAEWAGGNVNSEEAGSLEGPVGTEQAPLTLDVWKAITATNDFYDDTGSSSFGTANVDYDDVDKVFTAIQDLSALREQLGSGGPSGDFNGDGDLTSADIDALTAAILNPPADEQFDVDGNGSVDNADREMWVNELKNTYFGDANLDGEFNSGDVVSVFRAGKYENGDNRDTSWTEGDWDGDMEFKSGDLVRAFQAGGYELGPRNSAAAVPEPTSALLVLTGLLLMATRRRIC